MSKRNERIWIGLAATGTMLACICVAVGTVSVWWLAQRANAPQPAQKQSGQEIGRIAYIGTDNNIYTVASDGSKRQRVTRGLGANEKYNALAWSPNGYLAFASRTDESSALFTAQPDGSKRVQVYASGPDEAPFYLHWSPDSQWLTFLTSSSSGMDLRIASGLQADSAQTIAQGSRSYFSWSPDSQSLLMHVGSTRGSSDTASLSIFQPNSSVRTDLPDVPGLFQAPAWSPTGERFLFVRETDHQTDELVLAEGDDRRVLVEAKAHLGAGLAFTWSPGGDLIAFSALDPQSALLYDSVIVMDPAGQKRRVVAQGQIAAYFWSPDGGRLTVLRFDTSNLNPQGRLVPAREKAVPAPQSANFKLVWSVTNIADGTSADFPPFLPTDSFLELIPYFDQYAQSLSLWSPDGRYLLFADMDEQDQPAVRVLDTLWPQRPAQRLAEGTLAAWSWH